MKKEKMIRYMNLLDSKYIAEADPANAKNINKRKSGTSLILRYGALAASFILVVGVLLAMPYLQHDDPVFPDQTDNTRESTGPGDDTSNHGSESTDIPIRPRLLMRRNVNKNLTDLIEQWVAEAHFCSWSMRKKPITLHTSEH